ncbi:ATP-binding protein [Ruminococcus sp.]|uniref:HAMP domain-containing sensor histidine kinase n=1 Tax=Ruminococcus sp. TaxID=41978 RepID=UPI003AF96624
MKKHLISALRSERRRNYTMNASIVSAVFMIMIWAGLLTGFIMISIKRCLHFLSPLQMPFVFLIVGLVVSVIIGTCISAAVASKIVRPVREVKKAMHRVEKGDFSQRLEVTGFNGEIDELIESYNKMAQELGGIEMFRENFINSFSHEFKTPIVSIQGFAKQLKKENLSEEKKQEYIDIIISESKRLTNLSSNILMLSKLENQQIITDKTSFSLDEQIRNCILLLEKQWTAKDISFDIDMQEIQYTTNAEMLSQVWVNIIGNAIKFSPEGSSIRVKLFKEGDVITAEITDRGIGMDQQTISHIFERFYQGDRAHASEGNGLGLPLVKRIVELCNGNIRVESQYGKGTNFIVTLPQNDK